MSHRDFKSFDFDYLTEEELNIKNDSFNPRSNDILKSYINSWLSHNKDVNSLGLSTTANRKQE